MKIKVATSFSFRSDSRDGNERYISSAVTIEPDDDLSTSALELPNGMEAVYGIDLNEKSQPSTKPQEPQTTSQDYSLQAPRFMVLGKPCTGKTTLARQLCDQFGCELVNATELIEENLRNETEIGQLIRSIMTDGRDLDDGIVVKMIEQKLKSPACIKNGYVLDGIPTHSEHTFSIQKQLDFIFGLENPPNYLFDIQISNEELRNRWEDMRIDYKDGRLYPRETYNQEPNITPIQSDFPQLDAETKERLLTRHEELAENLDLHFAFYDSQVQDKLDDFKSKYDPSSIINVDGHVSPSARLESTLQKLKSISTTQSCDASDLPSRTPPKNTDRIQITTPQAFKADKNLWIGHAPRLVFFGKPGVGRTTLVKSLCEMWQCQYVNATELILKHISEQTPKGLQIASVLSQGEDLTDEFVIDLLNDRLGSSDCRQHGYIIDGLPTYTDDTSSVQRQIEFLEQLYPEPYFWVIIDISDDLLRKRWDSSRADRSSSPPSSSVRYSTQEFPSLDEKTRNRLLARHDVLPENLEAYLQFYNQYVEAPLNEFLGRCHPKTVIRFDGSNGLNDMGALLISSIRAIIDSCGLKSSSPRPKNSAPNLTLPLDQHVDPDLLSAGLIVDSVGSFDYLETPRSAPALSEDTGSENRQMPTDYKGFTGEFHLRTQYRSTASNASQISEAEQARMAAAFGTEINAPFIASKSSENSGIARDAFITDLEKPSGTSDTAIRANVKPTTPGTESPQCCCQCGFKFEKLTSAIWGGRIPRFLILGKPCTGKTALAKRMCAEWGCRLVSGTELVLRHLRESDHYGKLISRLMVSGRDLDDALMIQMITEELNSRECLENGFVIDDFPNYSEKSLSIGKQLEFLRSLNPGPEYIIEIQMPNDSQRARWDSVKIDMNSGTLYTDATYKLRPDARHLVPTCCVTIPDTGNAAQERLTDTNMLIKRFEELAESIENNNTFYHEVVEPQVRQWLETYYADMIITMDGDADMSEIFYMLHQKVSKILDNPSIPPRLLFMDKENSFVPGSCCRRCGARYTNLEPLPDLWADNPPRIAILGKPFTGKTTLARSLCTQWNCQLINATNIIQDHLKLNTPTGQTIREIFNSGADLSDNFVVSMLLDKLSSPGCTEAGYVLDGIPTHSEKSQSIASQLDFIRSLNPPPDYLILIEISDTALRERWEAVRIDVADGTLYTSRMFGHVGHHPGQPRGSCVRHADFPDPDETTRNRLITRHEELPENLDRHFQFYNANIAPQLRQFVASHDPSKVVTLDGEQSSNAMVNTLLYKLNVMARNPNVPTAELFVEPKQSLVKEDRFCKCPHHQQVQLEPLAELWLDKPPRVLIVGKPCTGKTTLAKRLCQLWKCELINASEMIQKVLNTKSERGKYVLQELTNGRDLNDQFILDLLCQAINSPAALDNGYILDGLPTHSEKKMSIPDQLQLIRNLENSPDYIIEIQMSDENLRDRWEAIRIDVADGTLYSRLNYDRCSVGTTSGRRTRHPDFPIIDESTKDRLLTRHEELAENLNRHFEFYSTRVEAPLRDYIASHDPSMVVRVKGDLAPSQLLQAVLIRLSIMSRHPGLDTSILFPNPYSENDESDDECECGDNDLYGVGRGRGIWQYEVPRVMIVGNSCSGKTTLARRLCKEWGCCLVNASDLIMQNLTGGTALGDQISNILRSGRDLPDEIVLRMIHDRLISSECLEAGYVLDDFPTSSEKSLPIYRQLEMLNTLPCRPQFIIQVEIPEDALYQRWEMMRIDLADGMLYNAEILPDVRGSSHAHPKFPTTNGNLNQRLLTRHEELKENIETQNRFYQDYVLPQISDFLQQYNEECVIRVDGTDPPAKVFRKIRQAIIQRVKSSACN